MKLRHAFLVTILVLVALTPAPQRTIQAQGGGETCGQLVERALSDLGSLCGALEPNSACYGYKGVSATLFGSSQSALAQPGDQTDLTTLASLTTSLIDPANGVWGIGVMNVQPDPAQPDQNAVYILLGDAGITNEVLPEDASYPLQKFSFYTGQSSPSCTDAPPSLLAIQSPEDTALDIIANDVNIRLAPGTVVFLQTLANDQVQVLSGSGHATVYMGTTNEVDVPAGTTVTAVTNAGTWKDWSVASQEKWDNFSILEEIPDTVWEPYTPPQVFQPSGIGTPGTGVESSGGVTTPKMPIPFPLINGVAGADLEQPTWSPIDIGCAVCDPDRVVYHSDLNGTWDIYHLDSTGKAAAQNDLTQGPDSEDIQPSYSTDSAWMAYASDRDGQWELYMTDMEGSQQVRLTYNSGDDINPVFGPTTALAFESFRDGNWEVYMFDVSGDGTAVNLTNDEAQDVNPFWGPNGGCDVPGNQWLVFQSNRDGDWEIYKLDVETMELTQLTDNDTADQVPVLSHDGSKLAWLQLDENGVYNLWVMDLATMEATQLTDTGVNVSGHTFSMDDALIAYQSPLKGDYDVFAVDVATDEIKPLTSAAAEDRAPTFRCDTDTVVYHSNADATADAPNNHEIYEVDPMPIDGAANVPARLTNDSVTDHIYPLGEPRDEIGSKNPQNPLAQ